MTEMLLCYCTHRCVVVIVSTEAVDTMDLARVRRRRRSVVRDFTVTALQPTVFISDDNLISCCLSRLICIDEFTYRSIFGKVFAKYFLKIVVHEDKHIPQRCLFYFCPKLPIFDVIFEK